jgi:hypothetical protein
MTHVSTMLENHPAHSKLDGRGRAQSIESLFDCIQACTSCADACLNETDSAMLKRCIASDLDCADVCTATARVLSRQTTGSWSLLTAQLQACMTACRVCAEECSKHTHEHCRVCAEACKACEQACRTMLGGMPQG